MNRRPRIIINADDFGLTEAVNEGILECCRQGALSSVSVLAVGEAFEPGVQGLLAFPSVGAGVHLCLNDERPLGDPRTMPTLTGPGGNFLPYRTFVPKLLAGKIEPGEVYREWSRQIERCLAAGLKPDHLDTHNHIHLFGPLFDIMIHLAEEYGIPAVRYCGAGFHFGEAITPANIAKYLLAADCAGAYRHLKIRGIVHPGRVRGFYRAGDLTEERLRRYARLPDDGRVAEIICHPGRGDSSAYSRYAAWNYGWGREMDALLAVFGTAAVNRPDADLVRFADLAADRRQEAGNPSALPLSVVIPALNEYENIRKTVAVTGRYLDRAFLDHEVVVVNDASIDGTGEAAAALLGPSGTVVNRTRCEGYGAALRAGFDRASREWIVYYDADYPVPVETIGEALKYAGEYDMVIGYRTNSRTDGLVRIVYRYGYALLIRALFGLRVKDINFAFKMFRKSLWDSLQVTSRGSFIDAELLIAAYDKGCRIKEIPVATLDRTFGGSRLNNFSNIFVILRETAAYYRRRAAARKDGR